MSEEIIRLDQFLKFADAVNTGGEAKVLIQSGDVLVNGEVETRRRRQLRHGDTVKLGDDQFLVEFGARIDDQDASNDEPQDWTPLEGRLDDVDSWDRPLELLAEGRIPAIVFRQAWPASEAADLIQRLTTQGLLHDPTAPITEEIVSQAIPEGYYREGTSAAPRNAWSPVEGQGRMRIDIGSSLGYRGSDKEAFLEHSEETRRLFAQLFADRSNPIELLYQALQDLAPEHCVMTACEPDGRQYGPAILRAHYGGYAYKPHFDSVRLREKRSQYAVHAFEHQFAGVLVLQNSVLGEDSAQGIIHRCLWNESVAPFLQSSTFHDYARENGIPNVKVVLQPGDLYFFNTRMIHEVPGLAGELPRVVLASFIGFTPEREEIFVWS